MYQRFFKRVFDLVLSGLALLALSPIMLLVAVAIRLEDGGPVLFRQNRLARDGKLFRVLKFRSMRINAGDVPPAPARTLAVTRVGKIIRRTNVDELPQLMNIFAGDMSIVGPRPALSSQTALLEMRRTNAAIHCKPGLTGLAQINSYDNMPEEEKAKWDGIYATSVSLFADLRIILGNFRYLAKPPPVY